jgi:exopolyphosphatase/guanosine-5'-triphosphate,3'-diphosphate pyrophosphatase
LIGVLGLNGKFHIILKERDLTRLGEGGLVRNRLTRASMRRALEVLRRYAAIMRRCGVDHVEAVATSAVREAANGRAFIRQVRRQLKLPLRMISGRQEARLIYLGVLASRPFRRTALIVTIGGGSAQVMCGDGGRLRYVASVPLGGARLAQRFIRHDPARPGELAALAAYVQRTWQPVARALRRHRRHEALGTSATIYQLCMAARFLVSRRRLKDKTRLSIALSALRHLTVRLARSARPERIQLEGLDPRREDLALPTAVTLLGWMEACGVKRLRAVAGSLREGLILDYLIRHHQGRTKRIEHPLVEFFSANGIMDVSLLRRPKRWGLAASKA